MHLYLSKQLLSMELKITLSFITGILWLFILIACLLVFLESDHSLNATTLFCFNWPILGSVFHSDFDSGRFWGQWSKTLICQTCTAPVAKPTASHLMSRAQSF